MRPRGGGTRRRRRLTAALGASLACASALTACAPASSANTVNLYYAPEENLQTVVDRCNAQSQGRYHIVYNKLPREADGQREQMVRRLAAQDPGMDVLGLDVTWTGEFAEANWIREWTGRNKEEAERGTLEGPLETARSGGKLYAAPKNTNVQLLWYRADLVDKPPATWDEMIAESQRLKREGKPYWISFSGAQFEGLFVHFNTLVESAGGHIVSADGKRAEIDAGAVRALEVLRDFGRAGVTSPAMNNAKQDDVRMEFENGEAAFQLNWPFVYPSMQEDKPELAQKVKWARLPGVTPGVPSKSTIGGYNLAVSQYSTKPDLAFEAALCMRNPENQKFSAINDGVPPTIESVYQDPAMDAEYPMKETILEGLKDPGVRPVTPAAQNLSTVLTNLLAPVAAIDPPKTAEKMRTEVQNALDSKGVMP
ncbi:ABC transporter substrate-binding protein [Saccharopolyspora erythraea]|uniref:ABC transporter substrate-binding protein n=1 Tax=Saccharopolyspora erythraea TaxID=1836 RepID=UPI0002E7D964|nr:ABC transporter substrate-binding protein [Saccharopolyspora erythraea]